MCYPGLKEFLKLSKNANLIPVYKKISADLDTPVSAFLKIQESGYAFLLESVEGQEKIARYSFLGDNPCLIFESKGKNILIRYPHKKITRAFVSETSPLDEIKKIMKDFKPALVKGLSRFYGGMVGYMGYDIVRFFEEIPDKNDDCLGLPDSVFILTDTILIFDHLNHNINIVSNVILPCTKVISNQEKAGLYQQAVKKIGSLQKRLQAPIAARREKSYRAQIAPLSNFKKDGFQDIVKKAKTYIKKGDIIQVVLSQRFQLKIGTNDPFDIYRRLRRLNPSPYMFFLKLNGIFFAGSSPEMLVRCEDGLVQTRPIAGTRRRGRDNKEDAALARELLNDKKERAEHLMLVDLGRNDLGRVCKTGKVEVSEFMTVEKYSHVMHLVSEISGSLEKKYDIYDALRACFPAGTVTGSPKIRAMQIIDELENLRRGPYAGCVGYFSFSHNLDTCITIRTIVIKDKIAYIQAGAGIVADSIPENEYFESINKAQALVEAVTNS